MTTLEDQARSIFLAALERAPEEWSTFLAETCGDNAELRARVEHLLRAHEAMGSINHGPPAATIDLPADDDLGAVIGPYKLLEQIGEGGFGVVYMVEQTQPVRRKVALKVLKPGMDTRQVVARFEAERQALAILDHPNIAKVFDGGATPSGRPYFVMELVRGVPITQFCDQNHLTPRQRLELFLSVCSAVQHAHQKGIIHRDLKPSNVLVSRHDSTPVVKVIDFGVAKALGQELTDKTLFTAMAQMVGTPLYMSPEQAGMSDLDVDTRSDVYSLGVLLYELLTGTTPFTKERFKKAAYDEIRRIIREEEPPRPSTRLSESKDSLSSISAQRHTEPAKLTKLVRGELDWIVMKAMEKDRNRRYDTAAGFAADVQRHLNDEPVLASPPSALYRVSKFARRNKAGLAAAAFILLVIVLACGGVGWVARDRQSRRERAIAAAEAAWADVDRLRREGKWPAALSLARRTEALLTSAGVDQELGRRFSELCRDLEMADRLEEIRAQTIMTNKQGRRIERTELGAKYAQAFRDFEIDVEVLAAAEAAERIRERTVSEELASALDDWATIRWSSDTASAIRLLAVARAADPDPMRNRVRDAVEHERATPMKELAASDEIDHLPPSTLVLLAYALIHFDARPSAVEMLRRAQQQHPDDVWTNLVLADCLSREPATSGEAVGFLRAALVGRPHSVIIRFFLGNALQQQGKPRQALDVFRRAAQLQPDSPWTHLLLGDALLCTDELSEALAEFRRAVRLNARFDAPPPPEPDASWFRQVERWVELDDKLPVVLRGEAQPRDAAERAAYAFVCRLRGLEATSARWYGEAFALQPKLAQQNRYFAAWAAVLAGTGKGKDASGLGEGEKARLRGQARVWLRDELDAWRQRLGKESAQSRTEVFLRINCWLTDPDLGCLRDADSLGQLPEAERAEWEKLWRDFRELGASARSTK
jgi:serine/threonine protein kinase